MTPYLGLLWPLLGGIWLAGASYLPTGSKQGYVHTETLVEQVVAYGFVPDLLQETDVAQHAIAVEHQKEVLVRRELNDEPITGYFTQKLDHFDALETRMWQQKYYINTAYESKNSQAARPSPIYIYVGGEGPLGSGCVVGGFIYDLASTHGGLIVGLEHRFYGDSLPFPTLETENMRFLTSSQALMDMQRFLTELIDTPDAFFNGSSVTGPRPVITVGGSYPGVLSAVMRLKFPSLVAGSLASSAPMQKTTHFFEYNHIGEEAAARFEPACIATYTNATKAMRSLLDTEEGLEKFVSLFRPCEAVAITSGKDSDTITPEQRSAASNLQMMLYQWISIGGMMQYYSVGTSTNLEGFCDNWEAVLAEQQGYSEDELLTALRDYMMTYSGLYVSRQEGEDELCFSNDFESYYTDPSFHNLDASENGNYRKWFWQKCTWGGYFRTSGSYRPFGNDGQVFYEDLCEAVFGSPVFPDVEEWNVDDGGWHTQTTNVYFANGDLDGWHGLGVLQPQNALQATHLLHNASHCQDMSGRSFEPTDEFTQVHDSQEAHVLLWLDEWYAGVGASV
mmetsp:Transcript_11435/g.41839  ORF Transcript_11435/g.41839 Transcript_11435/m.41839 type:complete len:563 (-) Transcript_11435:111-1799(-)